MMMQEKVWDKIANPWKIFRDEPFEEVIEFLKNKKGNVLDLGCGSGRNFVKIDGKIYGVDFSSRMVEMARERAEDKNISAEIFKSEAYELPFNDNFFDHAIFIAVLHCIESKEKRKKSLEELFRVLKNGGEAMIAVWSRNEERIKNKPKEAMVPWTIGKKKYMRYYYIYDKKEFEDLLKSIGFKIISIKEDRNIVAIVKK
ncbi:MAG: class I SAM-dependent methyltransferase [Nanoarchaeota archaeon]|nr:class I SAM-dependent methyltransferase [Nanoarchaeota archaeon]